MCQTEETGREMTEWCWGEEVDGCSLDKDRHAHTS